MKNFRNILCQLQTFNEQVPVFCARYIKSQCLLQVGFLNVSCASEARKNKLLSYSKILLKSLMILRSITFIIPFQLSPVEIRNNVNIAQPNSLKCACSSSPSHGALWQSKKKVSNYENNQRSVIETITFSFYLLPFKDVSYFTQNLKEDLMHQSI